MLRDGSLVVLFFLMWAIISYVLYGTYNVVLIADFVREQCTELEKREAAPKSCLNFK